MTEQEQEQQKEFFAVVDRFINLANELVPDHGLARVSATILFAASRFNAHNYYASDGDPGNRQAMIDYYSEQYKEMLLENLDWLGEVYKKRVTTTED